MWRVNRMARAEILVMVRRAGFHEVTDAHFAPFRGLGPENRRPTEIAAAASLSKQAMNGLLGQLEQWGYLERVAAPDDGRARVVRLTARGRALEETIWAAGREVERMWRERIDEEDWVIFRRVLEELASAASTAGEPSVGVRDQRRGTE
jgi:DNA-binding MarR family transcriptional regulator